MTVPDLLLNARLDAGLTQSELAVRSGTSQATLSAYERGHKVPSAETLARVLAAAGRRLTTTPAAWPVARPSPATLAERGRIFAQALELAEALPYRVEPKLTYPPLALAGGSKS